MPSEDFEPVALGRLRGEVLAANLEPSGVPCEELRSEDLPVFTLDGKHVDRKLKPSSDLETHLHLYREFAGIGAVVQTHSGYATLVGRGGLDGVQSVKLLSQTRAGSCRIQRQMKPFVIPLLQGNVLWARFHSADSTDAKEKKNWCF